MRATLKTVESSIENGIPTSTAAAGDVEIEISEQEYERLMNTEEGTAVDLDVKIAAPNQANGQAHVQQNYPEVEIKGSQYGPVRVTSPTPMPGTLPVGAPLRINVFRSGI